MTRAQQLRAKKAKARAKLNTKGTPKQCKAERHRHVFKFSRRTAGGNTMTDKTTLANNVARDTGTSEQDKTT